MNVIGIDIGGTRIKVGLVKDGVLESYSMLSADPENGLSFYLPQIEETIRNLLDKGDGSGFRQMGIGFPGIVDTDKNKVIDTSSKYIDAPLLRFDEWAKDTFNAELKMDNDARLACLGEWRYGAGRGVSNLVTYTLGTGIGSAVVLDGNLLRGSHYRAGILGGHFIIDYKDDTYKCSCGKYGCVEAMASMWMIHRMAVQHPWYDTSLLSMAEYINWKALETFSEQGDKLALLLQGHCLEIWSIGLVNLIQAYDPERVVIGGGISNSVDTVLSYFKTVVKNRAWCLDVPEICGADFPDTAALFGAAALYENTPKRGIN